MGKLYGGGLDRNGMYIHNYETMKPYFRNTSQPSLQWLCSFLPSHSHGYEKQVFKLGFWKYVILDHERRNWMFYLFYGFDYPLNLWHVSEEKPEIKAHECSLHCALSLSIVESLGADTLPDVQYWHCSLDLGLQGGNSGWTAKSMWRACTETSSDCLIGWRISRYGSIVTSGMISSLGATSKY